MSHECIIKMLIEADGAHLGQRRARRAGVVNAVTDDRNGWGTTNNSDALRPQHESGRSVHIIKPAWHEQFVKALRRLARLLETIGTPRDGEAA